MNFKFVAAFFLCILPIWADCRPTAVSRLYELADAVFIGQVSDIRPIDPKPPRPGQQRQRILLTFQAIPYWKGLTDKEVLVYATSETEFEIDRSYLVFARSADSTDWDPTTPRKRILVAAGCSGTVLILSRAGQEMLLGLKIFHGEPHPLPVQEKSKK